MTNKTLTLCNKCGAHIKHIHTFNGKEYGGDCVQVVAGLNKWELRTAGTDIDSYLKRKSERAAQIEKQALEAELEVAKHTATNGWLIDYLEQKENSFAHSLAGTLRQRSYESLSDKQKEYILWFWMAPYSNMQKGLAMFEFVSATEGMEPYEIPEAQEAVASYATLAELKEILKDNGIKGYSKLGRQALEETAAPFINIL